MSLFAGTVLKKDCDIGNFRVVGRGKTPSMKARSVFDSRNLHNTCKCYVLVFFFPFFSPEHFLLRKPVMRVAFFTRPPKGRVGGGGGVQQSVSNCFAIIIPTDDYQL